MKYMVTGAEDAHKSAGVTSLSMKGWTGKLCRNICEAWLMPMRRVNPAILGMFRDRDVKPYRDLLPWSGEFAGKHITGAYYVYKVTGDERLKREIEGFIEEMISCQDEDGYLGCFSRECRLTGAYSQTPDKAGDTWDSWNHYHIMYGLLLWHDLTGKMEYLSAAERIAALFMRKFYGEKPPLSSIGWCEMNLAVLHGFVLLYRVTGKDEYLRFAREAEADVSSAGAGDYIENALAGRAFYECPKPRWESLHVIMGILEMYAATGEERDLYVARQIVKSILKTDVHNTGAFSTDEQAVGDPYKKGNIETCCAVAFDALAIRLFRLTGDMELAEHLERAHFNAMLGAFSPTGAWSTYNTPMDGEKRANFDSIQFQCRPGSPLLNCCSVNAPRGAAEVGEWMLTCRGDTLCVHMYEAFEAEAEGAKVACESGYPGPGIIRIRARGSQKVKRLALRIPMWSEKWACRGNREYAVEDGYAVFPLGEGELTAELELDFGPRFMRGEGDCRGLTCVYAGPVLLGLDASDNPGLELDRMEPIQKSEIENALPQADGERGIVWRAGRAALRDFYHLGETGAQYRTWLRVE